MLFEFIVAPIYLSAVGIVGMPDFCSVPASALSAFDFAGENRNAAVTPVSFFPALDFLLHPIKQARTNDGLVIIFHIVLRYFALIFLALLRQKIHGELLLKKRIAFVFLVGQDTEDRPRIPLRFSGRCLEISSSQLGCDRMKCVSIQE